MTLQSQNNRINYTATGDPATDYSFPFWAADESWVIVAVDGVDASFSDYTVDLANSEISFVDGSEPASGKTVTVYRAVPLDQQTDYTPNGPFPAESHEQALDKAMAAMQELNDGLQRSIVLPVTDDGSIEYQLPTNPDPDQILGINGGGDGLEWKTVKQLDSVAIGTADDEVPTNADLPNSPSVGPETGKIPRNSDLDGRGFAQQVDSVSDLRSGSYPSSLGRIWLSGYYGVGTAGGGPLYRDSSDTTTADNGEDVFVDADGVRWKRPLAYGLNEARNYTDLRGNDPGDIPDNLVIYLHGRSSVGGGGEGHFRWDSSDLSTEVGNDEVTTGEGDGGIYVAPDSDKTGASGAWVRQNATQGADADAWYGGAGPIGATDGGTDSYESDHAASITPEVDAIVVRDFQSVSTTTTPTLDGDPITDREGSALSEGALSGVHALQRASGSWLVLDPVSTQSGTGETAAIDDFSFHVGRKRDKSSDFRNLTWLMFGNPTISEGGAGAWNEQRNTAGMGMPMLIDGRWWYYHSGLDGSGVSTIGTHISDHIFVSSFNGPGSTRLNVGAGGQWDDGDVTAPSVILHDGFFKMWYSGKTGPGTFQVGLATSTDRVNFSRSGSNPVLSPGAGGEWDDQEVGLAAVIWDGSQFVMAYTGRDSNSNDFGEGQIGIATSPDGVTWTKNANNPVIPFGGGGSFYETGALNPVLWIEDGVYYLNFSGKEAGGGNNSQIGHAYTSDLGNWNIVSNPIIPRSLFDSQYTEIEKGAPIRIDGVWYLFTDAYVEGKIVLFMGV